MTEKGEYKKSASEEVFNNYASLAFVFVIFIFGIPIWWKTTEINRETLPNADILKLTTDPLQISTNIYIYTSDPKISWKLAEELAENFKDNTLLMVNVKPVPVNKEFKGSTPSMLEKSILHSQELAVGDFIFIEWQKLEENILLTTDRSAYFSKRATPKEMYDLLMAGPLRTFPTENDSSVVDVGKSAEHLNFELKSRPLEDQHDILISVLNQEPGKMNIRWNVQETVKSYLQPFLDNINLLTNFSVNTQWKYHVPLKFSLSPVLDDTPLGRHYKLSENQLPHIITSIEKFLDVGISEKYQTHLVVYIMPCDISPVCIYKEKSNGCIDQNNLNSFVSLKWGGIIIYNPPIDVCMKAKEKPKEKLNFSIKSSEVIKTILYHLERIFEIHVDISMKNIKLEERQSLLPRKWEYDATLRRNTYRYIATTTKTLHSLINLLESISYIVINQDVGNAINRACNHIKLAREYLENGDLIEASIYAKKAYRESEEVFFDASLLAQLYFPDEQKYAIYIPLFLPIMVPVLTSLPLYKKFKK